MKIAILSPFYPFRGGLAQLNARLYTELSIEHEVKAYTFSLLYPKILFPGKTQYLAPGDSAQIIDSIPVLNSINPFSYIKTARVINKFAPDILIIPYWMSFLAPAYGSVCRLLNKKIKIISLVHNVMSHEKTIIEKSLAKYFLKQCDAYIVMSDLVRKDLLSLQKNDKILLREHPIYDHYKDKINKEDACLELNIDSTKKNLLFFGFIREYKGLDLLIEATNYLSDDYQLIIAGECYGSFDKYQKLIDESSLKNNIVVFDEYINDEMVSLLFSASNVLVLPYRSATQSGVVAMSYQLETPMIATNVGALGETISLANTGLVTADLSPKSIADTIINYFDDDRSEIFRQNIVREKEKLSWKSFIAGVEDFIAKKVC